MAKKLSEHYSIVKKVLWRFVRTFSAAFISIFSVRQFLLGSVDIRYQILEAAITGGIVAIFKALREGKDYDATIHKLPF